MPVQSNPCIQNVPTIAWDGTTVAHADTSKFVRFGWSFEVTAAIATDAVFNLQSAPPNASNPCNPGTFVPIPAIPTCQGGAVAAQATITIPAGTAVGTICSGTVACKGNEFVRLASASGTVASVRAVLIRQGPKM
jgi:hypothetical protein